MVLVFVYGNLICVLIKYFEDVLDEDIINYEIKIGVLFVYELMDDLEVIDKYYL